MRVAADAFDERARLHAHARRDAGDAQRIAQNFLAAACDDLPFAVRALLHRQRDGLRAVPDRGADFVSGARIEIGVEIEVRDDERRRAACEQLARQKESDRDRHDDRHQRSDQNRSRRGKGTIERAAIRRQSRIARLRLRAAARSEHRRQRQRKQQRCAHRCDDSDRLLAEQRARQSAQVQQRREDDHQRDRAGDYREGDPLRAAQHVAGGLDRLKHDDRVVDEQSRREREAGQRHHVERDARDEEHRKRREHRHRNHHRQRQRRPPTPKDPAQEQRSEKEAGERCCGELRERARNLPAAIGDHGNVDSAGAARQIAHAIAHHARKRHRVRAGRAMHAQQHAVACGRAEGRVVGDFAQRDVGNLSERNGTNLYRANVLEGARRLHDHERPDR